MSESKKKQVVIVSPALAAANNGNWQTARRWQQLLQSANAEGASYGVRIVTHWPDGPAAAQDAVMLALHARRSADSVRAWAQRSTLTDCVPGLAVVLTGTDLYRDIQSDLAAQHSLALAQRLVVLQELGLAELPPALQARSQVIFQSTSTRLSLPKTKRRLRALMVGHLREEKSPQTLCATARLLTAQDGIELDHVGASLDAGLAALAQDTAAACPHYRWLGEQAHEATRKRIQRAHVLIQTSRMEGGAHVVMEAVCSGTPVLASRVPGNVGMLGADYAGYFEWDDAAQLVALLRRLRHDGAFMDQLQAQCAARAPLFSPAAEHRALHQLVASLLANCTD